ncbi:MULTISPECIES: hypothetical protein [Bacillus]|uniref:SpbB protein n=2 Tax=Bacillus cereus group TaxID=86661 RepID=A0A2C1DW71_BACCE|nr:MULTISPECIES: hypothetical protein [Bacillus cereus group]OFD70492.1 hypothetical protein BWGOE8_55860 [Bacillus mycoides]OFD71592.1 hypothetical protein BWGOE10_56650 [Bacillus mycoides]OFD74600.1 hypothetical protein BWGOE9_38240 [Bacillus mycoides]PGT04703.1 hypothetical protein COD09_06915 [Bacillus cereus]
MKLTLFTISNEQIKEQLSKLQTKVESLETVKDVQDKIISAKDSQITFLQGEISSITSWLSIASAVIIALASAAFIYIKLLENKAKKKIEEAENTLQLVTDKLGDIETARQQTETNLTESDTKIEQLNSLIAESNNIATIAQEKIDKLEEKHAELYNLATTTTANQKVDMSIRQINIMLELSKHIIDTIDDNIPNLLALTEEQISVVNRTRRRYMDILDSYRILSMNFNSGVKNGSNFNLQNISDGVDRLMIKSNELYSGCLDLREDLNLYS